MSCHNIMEFFFKAIFIQNAIKMLIGKSKKWQEKINQNSKYVENIFQYNFVGRILGPRGMTAKQLEQETGCKIMVRGKGSMRDKAKVKDNFFFLKIIFNLFEISAAEK